ncbi:DSHCT domain protein [Mycobacterium kansasii 662]|uniref:DSHCT domain protein n=1 Tax=Mycobacterium kansasii 662 TaxID=1299326 RepID=X7XRE0_MYCKA|nr:hypothetical protein [Mycobacterium kansasii]ETZ96817.1 DSHCT domain protein [Mycobacterium kansasii 662]
MLARIYSESDLLVAECLRTGAWAGLKPPELAAVVSAVLYESRGSDEPSGGGGTHTGVAPGAQADREAVGAIAGRRSRRTGSARVGNPTTGFVNVIYRWRAPVIWEPHWLPLMSAAPGSPLSAGDFRALVAGRCSNLLDQVRNAAPDPEVRARGKARHQRHPARRRRG